MAAIETLQTIDRAALAGFDQIIDVRSPAEYAEDHIPGAINLPVLSDAERAEVGTIYARRSKFEARRIGAALVARNIAAHLEGALADRGGGFRPLLYCWRGGMRSHAMATVLAEVGWRVGVLNGGYKTYRAWVRRRLYDEPLNLQLVLLDGHTGTAKTEILRLAAERGLAAIDLEDLASHRGSLLGALPGRPQPDQRLFESRLLDAIDGLDTPGPVLVEAESSKIGELILPPSLWKLMGPAARIELRAPPPERARYLVKAYGALIADRETLVAALGRLPQRLGKQRLQAWRETAEAGELEALAGELMEHHYDPAYRRSSRKDGRTTQAVIEMTDLTTSSLEDAVRQISALWAETGREATRGGHEAEARRRRG
jgi:tRNA 2-selenouridine synthase